MNEFAEGSFSLNETIGNFQFSAEIREPNNKFDGINIVGNHDQFSLLLLDEFGYMVQSKLEMERFSVLNFFL
jgi:hypothetical protein